MTIKPGDTVRFVGKFREWGIYPEDIEQGRQLETGMLVESVIDTPLDENPNNQAVFCVGFSAMFSTGCLRIVKSC